MPQFSESPPNDPRGHALPLRRCPQFKPLTAIVTSVDLIGCPTHFFGGRTVPCEKQNCEPCLNGSPWRWHSYLSAWDPANKIHFLFESTARASEAFVQYREANAVLRGCLFRAQRMNSRPNARVSIETKPADLEKIHLPKPPDLTAVLSIIWNLPLPAIKQNGQHRNMPHCQVDQTIPSAEQRKKVLQAFADDPSTPKSA